MILRTDNNNPNRYYLDDILIDISHFKQWRDTGRYQNKSSYSGNIPHRIGEISYTLKSTGEILAGTFWKKDANCFPEYIMKCLKQLASFGYNILP